MYKLKKSKRKSLETISEQSLPNNRRIILDEKQVRLLSEWLDRLNEEKLIILTDQDDIVILAGGKSDSNQQIFVNSKDINIYMERKELNHIKTIDQPQTISMSDLARILLIFNYVYESSGQLLFDAHTIVSDSNQFKWLKSTIDHVKINSKSSQIEVKLFDGENTQILFIPFEYLTPTDDKQIIARYLLYHGRIRYDVNNRTYAYRYIQPDPLLDNQKYSLERISQRQLLSFHIKNIYVDEKNKHIRLQFHHQPNDDLILPIDWYNQIFNHQFDRDYILDILLANGGVINRNRFIFMGHTFLLEEQQQQQQNSILPLMKTMNLSWKEKSDLIHRYINLIIEMDAVKKDQTNKLLLIQNDADGQQLYFTLEHSLFIEKNHFRREDVIRILLRYSQIKQDQYDKWFLIYNNQSIRLPSSILLTQINNNRISSSDKRYHPRMDEIFSSNRTSSNIGKESIQRYDDIIDYMCRHGLVIWDKSSNVIRLQFADRTLLLPIDHLQSMIDPRLQSSTNAHLPFTSRQLSQWLRNNSYITRQNSIERFN